MFKWRTRELIVLILIAGCIRAPLTSLSPQINQIREDLGISVSLFGFLTSIPVICFAIAAPLPYTKLFRRISNELLIVLSLFILGFATISRSIGNSANVFIRVPPILFYLFHLLTLIHNSYLIISFNII